MISHSVSQIIFFVVTTVMISPACSTSSTITTTSMMEAAAAVANTIPTMPTMPTTPSRRKTRIFWEDHCQNNRLFSYFNNLTCHSIRKGDETHRQTLCQDPIVRDECPQSCGLCCTNDPYYTFRTGEGEVKKKDCEWILLGDDDDNDNSRKATYCDTYISGRMVRDACPKSCGLCQSLVVSLSNPNATNITDHNTTNTNTTNTIYPTPSPPSSAPSTTTITANSTSSCIDDSNFRINYNSTEHTCRSIYNNEPLRQALCSTTTRINSNNNQGPVLGLDVRSACPKTCGLCCADDSEYTFQSKTNELVNCEWVSFAKIRKARYCDQSSTSSSSSTRVGEKCTKTCGNCKSNVPLGLGSLITDDDDDINNNNNTTNNNDGDNGDGNGDNNIDNLPLEQTDDTNHDDGFNRTNNSSSDDNNNNNNNNTQNGTITDDDDNNSERGTNGGPASIKEGGATDDEHFEIPVGLMITLVVVSVILILGIFIFKVTDVDVDTEKSADGHKNKDGVCIDIGLDSDSGSVSDSSTTSASSSSSPFFDDLEAMKDQNRNLSTEVLLQMQNNNNINFVPSSVYSASVSKSDCDFQSDAAHVMSKESLSSSSSSATSFVAPNISNLGVEHSAMDVHYPAYHSRDHNKNATFIKVEDAGRRRSHDSDDSGDYTNHYIDKGFESFNDDENDDASVSKSCITQDMTAEFLNSLDNEQITMIDRVESKRHYQMSLRLLDESVDLSSNGIHSSSISNADTSKTYHTSLSDSSESDDGSKHSM